MTSQIKLSIPTSAPNSPPTPERKRTAALPITLGKPREQLQLVGPSVPAQTSQRPPNPMAILIDLESEARACQKVSELRFAIVNSTRKLAPFDQALLLERQTATGRYKISLASSTQAVDRHGTLPRAIESFVNHPDRRETLGNGKIQRFNLAAGDTLTAMPEELAKLPFALWVPLSNHSIATHVLLALKEQDWDPAFESLIAPLAGAYGHALQALQPKPTASISHFRTFVSKKRVAVASMVMMAVLAFVPVPLTALAPAEIIASSPALITAPLDGVIQDILVAPGTIVEKDTILVRFSDTKTRNELELAVKARSVAEAKYFRVLQSAVSTSKDMQELSVAKAELAMAEADLAYAREMLARTELKATKPGLAIYSAKSDWIGKPVAIGERIMEIADPALTEIRVDVPVSDAIALKQGAPVSLFLDGDPLHAVAATIDRVSYRPSLTPDKQMVFKIAAKFNEPVDHRIGLRGTARLQGDSVTLGFYLFRRPMAFVRQKIGY